MSDEAIVVGIDGPAGAGKSTVAKRLATRLNFQYLDTGAMYRSVTLKAMRLGVDLQDGAALSELAALSRIELGGNPVDGIVVMLDGEDVSEDIRTPEVTNNTFYIASQASVRAVMVAMQQEMGKKQSVVMEGRDIGTVVFPDAAFKFYLDAAEEERARRRFEEFQQKGQEISFEEVLADVKARDEKDFTRDVGPLCKADDAIVIDSSQMTINEVVEEMAGIVEEKNN